MTPKTIKIRFVSADGNEEMEVLAPAGSRLLDIAQNVGQPLEGTCEGQMACSTCHVIVAAEDFAKLPPAGEEEEDMLDLAAHVTRRSRLACQIWLTEELDALTVHIPSGFHNMQGR
jgi:ferredoxin